MLVPVDEVSKKVLVKSLLKRSRRVKLILNVLL